jgi:spore coat protein U-like protein
MKSHRKDGTMIAARKLFALSVGIAALALAGAAHAQFPTQPTTTTNTATGNLRVQATVLSQCAVQDSTLDFGQVTPTPPIQPPQTDIRITCTAGLPFTVGIGNGENAEGGQRRMRRSGSTGALPGDFLGYELYKNISLTDRWGDALISERVSGVSTGQTQTAAVFGKLNPSGPASGNFVDNAVITIYF